LFFFAFFHPLGEAGFRVDESFSGVTHVQCFPYVVRRALNIIRATRARDVNVFRSSCGPRRARAVSPSRQAVVRRRVRGADARATAGMAPDRARRLDPHPRADRQREDADSISLVPQPFAVRAGAASQTAMPRALRLAVEGAGG